MKHLDGVLDAKVNFGAAKLTVYGNTEIKQLEEAGAFEELVIQPEKGEQRPTVKVPFWKKYLLLEISFLLIFIGYLAGEKSLLGILSFAASILIGGYPLFKTGLRNLAKLQFDMRTLMTLAIIGAALIGQWSEGAVVVILFAISEALERYSMDKARHSIGSLMEMAPKEAIIIKNGKEVILQTDDIEIGDTMLVKPGQLIAMDGLVIEGTSAVNQAAITGESVPAAKSEGDEVFAGTLNGEGLLKIKVTKIAEDTTIAKIIHLVEEAQGEKAPSQRFVDRFAQYYTPAIMIIAALVAIIPPLLFHGDWSTWIYQGLAVLVVGCPCALVVSTPVSIVTAIGNAARNGVLIKGGNYLEEAGALKAIAFDKTGTLTKGIPVVTDFIIFGKRKNRDHILAVMAALESRAKHPLASAIIKFAEKAPDLLVEEFTSTVGMGIAGKVDGTHYFVGNLKMIEKEAADIILPIIRDEFLRLQKEGKTVMAIADREEVLAIAGVADEVRGTSKEVVSRLYNQGIEKTILLTGDNHAAAEAIGKTVGMSDVKAELLPQDKLHFIKELQRDYGSVAMVGDGVNDAPALATAAVGIAMGGAGSDTALETADIVLMNDDLRKLPFTIKLSRKTLTIIKQNITFSLVIKVIALLLVIPGWLTLWIAIFADMGTTLLVTLNGLRLLKVRE